MYFTRRKIMAYISQFRFFVLPLGLLAIVSGYLMAENYDLTQLFWASLSFVFLHIFMASVNNTFDVGFDSVSVIMSKENPMVTGELTFQEARNLNLITPVLAVITSLVAGLYWTALVLIGIGLVILYDVKPFRFKDRISGILIVPFYLALPFLFGYFNAISGVSFPLSVVLVFVFLYVNGVSSVRHIPDIENDIRMRVHNFTASFGVRAARNLEISMSVLLLALLLVAIGFNLLSMLGLPFLLFTTLFRIRTLTKPAEALRDPTVWKQFAQMLTVNSAALTLSIAGTTIWA